MSVYTPWGKSDYCQEETEGIKFYGTPSHGGYFIPKKLNARIPEYMRLESQWYEEDCDWCLPVIALGMTYFPSVKAESFNHALATFRNWHPAAFEKFFSSTLKEGESYIRDQELFRERTRDRLVVVAAHRKSNDSPLVICHACLGGRGDNGRYPHQPRIFLVPMTEYETRGNFGFIIDPARHQEITEAEARAA